MGNSMRQILSVAILASTVNPARASFTDDLLTDLAPIISLFGEQVTKQWLAGSYTWYECVIFAACPLGIMTAIVSAIRVAGKRRDEFEIS